MNITEGVKKTSYVKISAKITSEEKSILDELVKITMENTEESSRKLVTDGLIIGRLLMKNAPKVSKKNAE
jgi:hypothetical protein